MRSLARSRVVVALTAALALLAGVVAGPTAANADDPFLISGIVSDADGPLGGMTVTLGLTGQGEQTTTTGVDGSYSFGPLASGNYRVRVDATDIYAQAFWDHKTTQDSATVLSAFNGSRSDINITVSLLGSISGTVTTVDGPLDAALVQLLDAESNEPVALPGHVSWATTSSTGTYSIPFVPQGDYVVQVVPAWYQDYYVTTAPATVLVGANMVKDLAPAPYASISGTITGPGGVAVDGATVTAYEDSSEDAAGSTVTNSEGHYKINRLEAGGYTLHVDAPSSGGVYLSEWLSGKTTRGTALPVAVSTGQQVVDINTQLKAGSVAGTVRDPDGDPVSGAYVALLTAGGSLQDDTLTDEFGHYLFESVAAGQYALAFGPPDGTTWQLEYWHHQYPTMDGVTPNFVTVVQGLPTAGIDMQFVTPDSITGTVTNTAAAAIEGVTVTASAGGVVVGTAVTDASGFYAISGLAEGDYTLSFSGTTIYESGDEVSATLTSSGAIGGIDAVLLRTPTLSGTVRNLAGGALSGATVSAYDAEDHLVAETTTSATGAYAFTTLPVGEYRIYFSHTNTAYTPTWFGGAATYGAATPVTIASEQAVTSIDGVLSSIARIGGTIRGTSNALLAGATVSLYDSSGATLGSMTTTSNGTWGFAGLVAGSYKVKITAPGYQTQWFSGKSTMTDATPIVVAAGAIVTGKNVVLAVAASLSGTLSSSSGSGPVVGATVRLETAAGQLVSSTTTNSVGKYTFTGLTAGSYKVQFSRSGFLSEWYVNAAAKANATPIAIATGTAVTANAVLTHAGSISGKVTGAGGVPLGGMPVQAYSASGGLASTTTDTSGNYTISGLVPGGYKLRFVGKGTYATEWYSNKVSQESALSVAVKAGMTTSGRNASLESRGRISGTVTGPDGAPLVNATVLAYSPAGEYISQIATTADGKYTLSDLAPGTYMLQFSYLYAQNVQSEWYNNQQTQALATPIVVAAGQTVSGKNATLALKASLSGKVTGASSAGLAGISVQVKALPGSGFFFSPEVVTDSLGNYSLSGLPAGRYTVKFVAPATGGMSSYVDEWFGGVYTADGATVVSIAASQTVTGINGALGKGASISGKITTAGHGLEGARVQLTGPDGALASVTTSSSGTFVVPGLRAGSYKIGASATGYLSQWWPAKTSLGAGSAVAVTGTQAITGKNLALVGGASIEGTVSGTAGALSGVNVSVEGPADSFAYSATTDSAGHYAIVGLQPGSYALKFSSYAPGNGYAPQYYGNKYTQATATKLTVVSGQHLTGRNITLKRGATISGVVSGGTPADPVAGVHVNAMMPDGRMLGQAVTTSAGQYTIGALPPGPVLLSFNAPDATRFYPQYYGGATDNKKATPITVAAEQVVVGKNVSLVATGTASISGVISGPGGVKIGGATVIAVLFGSDVSAVYVRTDAYGNYSATGLRAGTYKLRVMPSTVLTPGVAGEWYNNKTTEATATIITVATGQAVTGKNVVLDAFASISGKVTNAAGKPLANAAVRAYDSVTQEPIGTTFTTDAAGNYAATGLPAGSYKVLVDAAEPLQDTWFGGVMSFSAASTIAVGAGKTAPGKNITVLSGASISGKITNSAGEGVEYISVQAWRKTGSTLDLVNGDFRADSSGNYTVSGLFPGTYVLSFKENPQYRDGAAEHYASEFYNNKTTAATATTITVKAGASVTGKNVVLAKN